MSYNNIVSKINKYFLLFALFTISFTISSCSTSNDAVNDDSPIINPEEPSEPTNIHPILEWGKSMSEIKTKQKSLVNDVENDTLLRFTNKAKTVVVDYFFKNNSLVCASMTQANIANVKDIMDKWANGIQKSQATIMILFLCRLINQHWHTERRLLAQITTMPL